MSAIVLSLFASVALVQGHAIPRSTGSNSSFTISSFNSGMFGTVAHYDERRLMMVDSFKKEIDSDVFCQNELWYKQDVDLLMADEEWTTRYPYHYFVNNQEMDEFEAGNDLPSLCPSTTLSVMMTLMGVEACQTAFQDATNTTGKGYNGLAEDLFTLLKCWETNSAEAYHTISDDRTCFGCLLNTQTSGDGVMGMTKCMTGSTKEAPNDHAYESFLYGLAIWSKYPLENVEGHVMSWDVVPRGFISAELPDRNSGFICTHVGVGGVEQQGQFKEITDFVNEQKASATGSEVANWFLIGDLNSGPTNEEKNYLVSPNPADTNGTSSSSFLNELGWYGIYNNCENNDATWIFPTEAGNFTDGNTNICGHTTGILCSDLGENDSNDMLLDHVMVLGDLAETKDNFNCKRTFDEKYGDFHISDHFGIEVEISEL
eukprot:Awhi_evm1s145